MPAQAEGKAVQETFLICTETRRETKEVLLRLTPGQPCSACMREVAVSVFEEYRPDQVPTPITKLLIESLDPIPYEQGQVYKFEIFKELPQ